MAYIFRPGLSFGRINPNTAGRELERIRKKYKQLAPRHVVAEAEPPKAPLHAAFEWDDSKAAQRWREDTARNLIRSVVIVRENDERAPMYVHVKRENREDNGYELLSHVVSQPDMLAVAIEELRDNMVAAAEGVLTILDMTRKTADKQRSSKVVQAKKAIDDARRAVQAI